MEESGNMHETFYTPRPANRFSSVIASLKGRRVAGIIIIIFIVIALPLTILVIKNQQNLRQMAVLDLSVKVLPVFSSPGEKIKINANGPQSCLSGAKLPVTVPEGGLANCINDVASVCSENICDASWQCDAQNQGQYLVVISSEKCTASTPFNVAPAEGGSVIESTSPGTTNTISSNGQMVLDLTLSIPGIGKGLNENPIHGIRDLQLCLYDLGVDPSGDINCEKGTKVTGIDKTVAFDRNATSLTYGKFINHNFPLSSNILEGQYQVFLSMKQYLRAAVPGTVIITAGKVVVLPEVTTLKAGDINGDSKVDNIDYMEYNNCFGNKGSGASCLYKETSDLNDDGIIDLADLKLLFTTLETGNN